MTEIEELKARVEAIEGIKIIDMDLEELKTFVLTLNSKQIITDNKIKKLVDIINELKDNLIGFRSGVAERYLTIDASNSIISELLQKIKDVGVPQE